MAAKTFRTIWFPKDQLIGLAVCVPLCAVGGVVWAAFMNFAVHEQFVTWLLGGMIWAAAMWCFLAVFIVIAYREIGIRITADDATKLQKQIREAAKRVRYTVEPQSPTGFLCKAKMRYGLARINFDYTRVNVEILDDSVELTGPALIVNRLRKELRKGDARV